MTTTKPNLAEAATAAQERAAQAAAEAQEAKQQAAAAADALDEARAARAADYDRRWLEGWNGGASQRKVDAALDALRTAVEAQPWFAAFVELQSEQLRHYDEATRAQSLRSQFGHPLDSAAPAPPGTFLDGFLPLVTRWASSAAADAEDDREREATQEREVFVAGEGKVSRPAPPSYRTPVLAEHRPGCTDGRVERSTEQHRGKPTVLTRCVDCGASETLWPEGRPSPPQEPEEPPSPPLHRRARR